MASSITLPAHPITRVMNERDSRCGGGGEHCSSDDEIDPHHQGVKRFKPDTEHHHQRDEPPYQTQDQDDSHQLDEAAGREDRDINLMLVLKQKRKTSAVI